LFFSQGFAEYPEVDFMPSFSASKYIVARNKPTLLGDLVHGGAGRIEIWLETA
jgi:hypothetical protein